MESYLFDSFHDINRLGGSCFGDLEMFCGPEIIRRDAMRWCKQSQTRCRGAAQGMEFESQEDRRQGVLFNTALLAKTSRTSSKGPLSL